MQFLYKMGYKTDEPFKEIKKFNLLSRKFTSKNDTISINVISDNVKSRGDFIENYLKINKPIIFSSSYSSLILNTYLNNK